MWGALSDERTGLWFTAVIVCTTCHLLVYLRCYMTPFYMVSPERANLLDSWWDFLDWRINPWQSFYLRRRTRYRKPYLNASHRVWTRERRSRTSEDRSSLTSRAALVMSALAAYNLDKEIGPGREADYSPPSSAEVKKGGAILPLPHTSSWHSA
jgi:hypothetical protein